MEQKEPVMRFPELPKEQWTDAQRRLADEIAAGPRGEIRGPFLALIYSPELASRVQKLGEYLRFESAFSSSLTEIAVLLTARRYDSANVWHSHRALALKSGLNTEIIAAIASRRRPAIMSADEADVFDFSDELLSTGQVTDATFSRVTTRWGEGGAADLIVLVGYYITLCHVYNVSKFSLPESTTPFQP
jgi:4-carboxymuconolactone decarboxylase